ncbi:hypothetical protein [Spirosoma endbachense]|uniref:DUF3303 domain-containing protein n=1 Tax=Spirosoma endbachense TaxID=2666025 RepID=A0A6P1VU71_9BACT|nr:hypothetical protein [Spirosoma endbachense]QHV95169.1 hypothetical protein GJR95_09155 [Spirosoma endbachense]
MWYFLIKQADLEPRQYRALLKKASLTEVELFNEPYENWYIFSVEKGSYPAFMNYLDLEGISYDLNADRPTRDEMLAGMR